jgi:hypothetical protein
VAEGVEVCCRDPYEAQRHVLIATIGCEQAPGDGLSLVPALRPSDGVDHVLESEKGATPSERLRQLGVVFFLPCGEGQEQLFDLAERVPDPVTEVVDDSQLLLTGAGHCGSLPLPASTRSLTLLVKARQKGSCSSTPIAVGAGLLVTGLKRAAQRSDARRMTWSRPESTP